MELIEAEKQVDRIDLKTLAPKQKVALQLEKLELRKLRNRIKAANAEVLQQVDDGVIENFVQKGKQSVQAEENHPIED